MSYVVQIVKPSEANVICDFGLYTFFLHDLTNVHINQFA